MSNSDVESFQGKIVYNLDGSAYIIDPENASYPSSVPTTAKATTAISAEALNSSGGGRDREKDTSSVKLAESPLSLAASSSNQTPGRGIVDASPGPQLHPSPKIHSFRIVSAHDAVNFKCHRSNITVSSSSSSRIESDSEHDDDTDNNDDNDNEGSSSSGLRNSELSGTSTAEATRKRNRRELCSAAGQSGGREAPTHLQNPILMCFICKLSFGNTKSFSLHAKSEHSLHLKDLEKHLLSREYSSAIIQRNMDEKPQISFLEPLDVQQMMRNEPMSAELRENAAPDEAASGGKASPAAAGAEVAKAETETDNETEIEAKSNGNCSGLGHSQAEAKEADATADPGPGASQLHASNTPNRLAAEADGEAVTSPAPVTTDSSKAADPAAGDARQTPARRNSSPEPSSTAASTPKSQPPSEVARGVAAEDSAGFHQKPNTETSPASRHSRRSSGEYMSLKDAAADFGLFQKQLQHSQLAGMFSAGAPGAPHHGQSPSPSGPSPANPSAAAAALSAVALSAALSQHNQLSSLHASLAALTNDPSTNSVKFISELLQHQLAVQQMQQEQLKHSGSCPDHPNGKGVDCKGCELLDVQRQIRSPMTPDSSPKHVGSAPSTKFLSTNTSLVSPTSHLLANATTAAAAMPTTVTIPSSASATAPAQVTASSAASSFTIGACSEHINGRPLGVDCSRCEMILNSARLNSGVQMSTRNSCKTLKCPQCNWHYKYQETLEIHMREKHPDGESACGYCLAGQQHPRLARGESYSCGYKPYRCEICNYSTTTKGNLSIHMQSDKHLNNMQELNSSQNMVAAAAAAAVAGGGGAGGPSAGVGKMDVSSKMLLGNSMNMQQAVAAAAAAAAATPAQQQHPHQQQQQQQQALQTTSNSGASAAGNGGGASNSGKPKPSFRCDICSYETSVARNLRIHMTSEKHTHNMAVLQNNIKHIQAFSLLQQHQQVTAAAAAAQQQQQQQQHLKAVSGNPAQLANAMVGGNFLPEVAIADFAYNQALMIQLLHQQQQQQQQLSSAGSNKSLVKMPPTSPTPPISDSPVSGSGAHLHSTMQHQHQRQQQFSPSCKGFGADAQSGGAAELCQSSTFSGDQEDADSSYGLSVNCALKPDPSPQTLYSCLVCEVFNTNSLDELNQHLLLDRTRQSSSTASSSDIVLILNNNYICRLCNYKTNLKANFQLHSKTDKHLQKLNFINHIREGGPRNDYKLKLHQQQQQQQPQQQQQQNVVQLKCNCCDYQTNSVQKLSLHCQHMRHETMRMIFQHLLNLQRKHQGKAGAEAAASDPAGENALAEDKDGFAECDDLSQDITGKRPAADKGSAAFAIECQLCNYVAISLHDMIQHVKSLRHLQVEQFICLQRRSENMDTPNLEDVFRWCGQSKSQAHPAALRENCPSGEEPDTLMAAKTERLSPGLPVTTDEENTSNSFFDANNDKCSPSNSIPSVIFKCNNNCDYFAHSKQEMELHSEEMHPNCETNFISIPTNAAAIRAFQAAMAAAAVAAVANSNQRDAESDKLSPEQDNDDDECPVAIKKERLEYDEPMDQDEGGHEKPHDSNETKAAASPEEGKLAEKALHTGDTDSHVEAADTPPPRSVQCPLCSDGFTEKNNLEIHLMRVHSVSRDGLSRLLQLVDNSAWKKASPESGQPASLSEPVSPTPSPGAGLPSRLSLDAFPGLAGFCDQSQSRPASTSSVVSTTSIQSNQPLLQLPTPAVAHNDEFRCTVCGCGFKHEQLLLQHAQKAQHYRVLNGEYACLASSNSTSPCPKIFPSLAAMVAHYKDAHISLVISERHVYKYRCKQCSLAFKTQEKLTTHTLYHAMRDATKCMTCQRNFRSTQALQKHMEQTHGVSATSSREHSTEAADHTTNSELAMEQAKSCANLQVDEQQCDLAEEAGANFRSAEKAVSPAKDQAMDASGGGLNFGDLSLQQQQQQQQQQVAAITAALLKQQQQQQLHQFSSANSDVGEGCNMPPNLNMLQHMPLEAGLISQKYMQQQQQQQQQEQNLLQNHQQSLQSLQNLQHLQTQLPQLAAAAAASGLPLNPVDMLNLMQFHHLMSLNFMNLAPPLIFGATASGSPANPGAGVSSSTSAMGTRGGSGRVTPTDMPSRSSSAAAPVGVVSSSGTLPSPSVDAVGAAQLLHPQQQQQTSPASAAQISNNQKRARTRITDEQLKILRAHFDINNSPSEESIMEMSQKANLPMKVVKHWFRNTLFKERQRNKDSPYNFNNPPSTTLNLEEYERTGQAKVTPLGDFSSLPSQSSNIGEMGAAPYQAAVKAASVRGAESSAAADDSPNSNSNIPMESQSRLNTVDFLTESHHLENRQLDQVGGDTVRSHTSSVGSASSCAPEVHIKSEPVDDTHDFKENKQHSDYAPQPLMRSQEQLLNPVFLKQQQANVAAEEHAMQQQESDNLSEHMGAAATPSSSTAQQQQAAAQQQNANYYNSYETKSESGSSEILSRPQTPLANPYNSMNEMLSQQLDNLPMNLGGNNMGPPKKFQMSKVFEKHSPSSAHFDTNSNSSNASSTSSGKRANRTRFTDYQIKVLQEFFENNSYPKDSDLEYLSKLLLLSPRVIVVWFQNARQKQRKIYENQPNNSLYESEEKKQNITYACKKCNLVFQRYYELIRHQKNHCFKEENNKKSAKAQIAAAQIAQNLSSEDSNSSMDIHNNNNNTAVAAAAAASLLSGGQHGLAAASSLSVGAAPGISPQHLAFGKSSSTSLVDFSPSTTPTPPHREAASAGNEAAAMHPSKMQKFECDKCKLSFNNYESFREHQLIHIMNPNLFLGQSPDAFGPFGSILQSLQQAAAANASQQQQQQQQQQQMQLQPSASAGSSKKRKYSETSSNADDMSSTGVSYAGESAEQQNKRYDFLYQYFLQNEPNAEVQSQFHAQQQQSQDSETEMEFLWNFYQQNEMRKRSNYDFLYQYYLKNEEQPQQQPNIEFLLQYYQLNESKKFFQLDASTQRMYNSTGQQQHPPVDSKESDTSDKNEHAAVANEDTCNASPFEAPSKKRAGDDVDEAADSFGNAIDCSSSKGPYRRPSSHDSQLENDENVNKLQVQPFGCEDYLKNNLKHLVSRGQSRHEQELSSSPIPSSSPGPSAAGNSYFHNLDDFLVATMIENNQQTLTFTDANLKTPRTPSASVSPSFAGIHGEAGANGGGDPEPTPPLPSAVADKAIKSSNNNNDTNNKVQQNKRLRTTILPEQLNFLYECYQNESNPSRKMLEEISKKVNLKKRVVQVWFQNSRAKDKKSRNQRFALSDDSNYEDSTRDLTASNSSCNNNTKLEAIQQAMPPQQQQPNHPFSLEHIEKVKLLLEQTSQVLASQANGNGNGNDNGHSPAENLTDDADGGGDCGGGGLDIQTSNLRICNDNLKSIQLFNLANNGSYSGEHQNGEPDERYAASTTHTHTPFEDLLSVKHFAQLAFPANNQLNAPPDAKANVNDDGDFSEDSNGQPRPSATQGAACPPAAMAGSAIPGTHSSDIMKQIFNYKQISVIGGK